MILVGRMEKISPLCSSKMNIVGRPLFLKFVVHDCGPSVLSVKSSHGSVWLTGVGSVWSPWDFSVVYGVGIEILTFSVLGK